MYVSLHACQPGGKAVIEAREAADNARRKARQAILRGADARRRADITGTTVSSPTRASTAKAHMKSSSIGAPPLRQPPTPSTILKANVRRQQAQKQRRQEVLLQQEQRTQQLRERQAARRAALSTPVPPPRAATATAAKAKTPPRPKQKHVEDNDVSRSPYKPEGKLTLSELCDEDKSKVAHLLAQAVHTAEAKKSAADAKDREKDWAAQIDKLKRQNKDVIEENAALKSKLSNAFSLLKVYQKKIRSMLDLNQKMQMDHNVAIVQLHKRYEDLEKMNEVNDARAAPAAAARQHEGASSANVKPEQTADMTAPTIIPESMPALHHSEERLVESQKRVDNVETYSHQQQTQTQTQTQMNDTSSENENAGPTSSQLEGVGKQDEVIAPTRTTSASANTHTTSMHVDVSPKTSLPDSHGARGNEAREEETSMGSDEAYRKRAAQIEGGSDDVDVRRHVESAPNIERAQPVLRFNPDVGHDGLFYYSPTASGGGGLSASAAAADERDSFGSPILGGSTSVEVPNDVVVNIPTGWNAVRRDALDARAFDKSLVDIVERVEEHARESALFGVDENHLSSDEPLLGDMDTAILLRDIAQLPEVSDFFCAATARPHSDQGRGVNTKIVEHEAPPSDLQNTTTASPGDDDEDQMLTALLNGRSFDLH